MFEFSGACAGCGETPYVKLLSQLFGDRLIIANACGCSSVYGGSLPTVPWTINKEGRGPSWSSSLFEDNAEFGFGFRLTTDKHKEFALELLNTLKNEVGEELVNDITNTKQSNISEINQQRARIKTVREKLQNSQSPKAQQLLSIVDQLVKRSIWSLGGDGWAYDIGFGGLDHVLSSGRNINMLVLDTEVYSNTGGQSSKSTPRGAVAKFAADGKSTAKKDLGLMMMTYGNIYVASIAMGANPSHAVQAMLEAESYEGPSLVIAYSHCIAHGFDMKNGLTQQKLAVKCGYWPLYRYNPNRTREGLNPFQLDCLEPSSSFREYAYNENRYSVLKRNNPEHAEILMQDAEKDIKRRWQQYLALAQK
jgi:pyruvate-ferredoxin/flavodoxin oxidoreductase